MSEKPTATADNIAATLRILKGDPTPEQIAAVIAALTAAQAQAKASPQGAQQSQQHSRWALPQLRRPLPHGAGAWRHSLRNR